MGFRQQGFRKARARATCIRSLTAQCHRFGFVGVKTKGQKQKDEENVVFANKKEEGGGINNDKEGDDHESKGNNIRGQRR